MAEAREQILRRVRGIVGAAPREDRVAAWAELPRGYVRASGRDAEEVLALFAERLRDYDARVEFCEAGAEAEVIGRLLRERGGPRMVVPPELPGSWVAAAGDVVVDDGLSHAALDACAGVLTGATVGIALTGTLVLQGVVGQGRRAVTLIPDYHLCVVRASDVVETVPEAMERLRATATLPTTFVSGPSATADIEMTRIKGVHGPRFLDVVVTGA